MRIYTTTSSILLLLLLLPPSLASDTSNPNPPPPPIQYGPSSLPPLPPPLPAGLDLLTATVHELSYYLSSGTLRSVDLVNSYLARIQQYDGSLHSIIETAPINTLLNTAARLDHERKMGRSRGPLHGVPILVKDTIATSPPFGLSTTAGSFALLPLRPAISHPTITRLVRAGALILGKTNLSVFSNFRAPFSAHIPPGWSPRGGQCHSPYTAANVSAGGSSTGSAVAVAAGFAPLSLAAETDGSIVVPANRASLYGFKPTVGRTEAGGGGGGGGLRSVGGAVPVARSLDSVGVMAKSVGDLAMALGLMVVEEEEEEEEEEEGAGGKGGVAWELERAVRSGGGKEGFGGVRIGVPDREVYFGNGVTREVVLEFDKAVAKMRALGATVVDDHVHMPGLSTVLSGAAEQQITLSEFKEQMTEYLSSTTTTSTITTRTKLIHGKQGPSPPSPPPPPRTLQELVQYNSDHRDVEMPVGYCCDENFRKALQAPGTASDEYKQAVQQAWNASRTWGVDYALRKWNVSVLMVPADSSAVSRVAALAGAPIAVAPLGVEEGSGRPYGVAVWTSPGRDVELVRVLAAWERGVLDGWRAVPDMGRVGERGGVGKR